MSNSPQKCSECGEPMTEVGQLPLSLDLNDPDATVWICRSPACRILREDALDDIILPPWVDKQY